MYIVATYDELLFFSNLAKFSPFHCKELNLKVRGMYCILKYKPIALFMVADVKVSSEVER
jgi:hypothetical protein